MGFSVVVNDGPVNTKADDCIVPGDIDAWLAFSVSGL